MGPGTIRGMPSLKTTPRSFLLRLSEEQREELGRRAEDAGMPIQEYIELRVFGEVRPRQDPRAPRKPSDQLPLPIEEEPIRKSA